MFQLRHSRQYKFGPVSISRKLFPPRVSSTGRVARKRSESVAGPRVHTFMDPTRPQQHAEEEEPISCAGSHLHGYKARRPDSSRVGRHFLLRHPFGAGSPNKGACGRHSVPIWRQISSGTRRERKSAFVLRRLSAARRLQSGSKGLESEEGRHSYHSKACRRHC